MHSELPFQSVNPFNGQLIESFDFFDINDLNPALEALHANQKAWAKQPFEKRTHFLALLADQLEKHADELAHLITQEIGKPIGQSQQEVKKSAQCCRFYSSHAQLLLSRVQFEGTSYQALGTILGIMPWNYPLWQIIRFCAPVMLMGNAALIKPAPNAPNVAKLLDKLVQAVSAHKIYATHFFRVADIEHVLAHKHIQGVSLTGSKKAGSIVASLAGRLIKKCVLELGGIDPFIVCEDASLELSVDLALRSRLQNNGQTCISAKRFLAHKSVYEKFVTSLCEKLKNIVMGDPSDFSKQLGPQARLDLQKNLTQQVEQSIAQGATLRFQLPIPSSCQQGFFYPPTVLETTDDQNLCMQEELFGPVFSVCPFKSDAQAIKVANGTEYGLGATLLSESKVRIDHFLTELESANIAVNTKMSSSIEKSFGGIKASGFGRELGLFGLLEFCNIQGRFYA